MPHKLVEREYPLPKRTTVDSLAEMFRAILLQNDDSSIQRIAFSAQPPKVVVEAYVAELGDLEGPIPTGSPETLWQALSLVKLEEVDRSTVSKKLNGKAIATLTDLMLRASSKNLSAVAWVSGDVRRFLRWLGVPVRKNPPSLFWNIPLIELDGLQEGSLVLMCGKSIKQGPMGAHVGFLTYIEEAEDARQGK
jgi:hypothetical protein